MRFFWIWLEARRIRKANRAVARGHAKRNEKARRAAATTTLVLAVQLMRGEEFVVLDLACSDGPAWIERARAWARRSGISEDQPQYICTWSDR